MTARPDPGFVLLKRYVRGRAIEAPPPAARPLP